MLKIDVAENQLGGEVKFYANAEVARSAVTSINSKTIETFLLALSRMAAELRSKLIDSEETLGALSIEAHIALDAVGAPLPPRLVVARTLTQISEENPIRPWQTSQHWTERRD